MILISIAMITYNHEKFIKHALESVLMQKEDEFSYEIIIGDDASIDGTQDILKEYRDRYPNIIKLILREKNIGATNNFYDVLKSCNGKYIAQLEGDDYWTDPNKLIKQFRILQSSNFIGVAHKHVVVNQNEETRYFSSESNQDRTFTAKDLIGNGGCYQTATIMYRNIFNDFNEDQDFSIIYKGHKIMCDITLQFLILDKGNIFYLNEIMSAYRTQDSIQAGNASNIFKRDYSRSYKEIFILYDKIQAYFDNKYNLRSLRVKRIVEAICDYYLNKSFSREIYKEILSYVPFDIRVQSYLIAFLRAIGHFIKRV